MLRLIFSDAWLCHSDQWIVGSKFPTQAKIIFILMSVIDPFKGCQIGCTIYGTSSTLELELYTFVNLSSLQTSMAWCIYRPAWKCNYMGLICQDKSHNSHLFLASQTSILQLRTDSHFTLEFNWWLTNVHI